MDNHNFPPDLGEKLVVILQKITQSNPKVADEVFLAKLLTSVKNELSKTSNNVGKFQELITWLDSNILQWMVNPPPSHVLAFVIQLIGIFSENEDIFIKIHEVLLDRHINNIKMHAYEKMNLKLIYITFLSQVVNHKQGCQWILNKSLWIDVVDMYLSKSGLFIEREAIIFLTKLVDSINWEGQVLEEIVKSIMSPLENYKKEFELRGMVNESNIESFQKNFETTTISILFGYTTILETWIVSSCVKSNKNFLKSFEMEIFWKFILETSENENLLEKVSVAYTLQSICMNFSMNDLMKIKEIPDAIFDIFKIFVKRRKISNIIKLAKYYQLFWNKVALNNSHSDSNELESHFIVIQLVPALLLIKKTKAANSLVDIYINKIFDLTSENTQRLGYLIRDVIKFGDNEHCMDYAFHAVLSVSKNIETLNLKRAVLIFQALANVLTIFIPRSCDLDEPITDEEFAQDQMLCFTNEAFLSSVLNAICIIIEKFKINWKEALESLCLLKFCSVLLNNPNLPPRLGVQTLSLIKLAISNFMSPNLALLINKVEGTSLECLMPIIYNRLHSPNWEIRDSCVEVIGIVAELADTKYPVFQDILIEGKYCELIYGMIDNDAESYVRSSALKALTQMIRIESLRNRYFNGVDVVNKIIVILKNESEGIVRREAALLAKELFDNQNIRSDSLFQIMKTAATCDLHWEVKVNALFFWEKVIQKLIADQGMIDGFFPSITFSKENKKIVSLTNDEIKSRLTKVLSELSAIGCLDVLVSTLKNDYDLEVVQKSAQIVTDLLDVLKRYNMFEKQTAALKPDKCSMKRKASTKDLPEKKMSHSASSLGDMHEYETNRSNKIIEDIVKELDLNLLENVYNPNNCVNQSMEIDSFPVSQTASQIKPDVFLSEMQNFNITNYLYSKRKWLLSRDDDLNELLNDILTLSVDSEAILLDCY